MTKRLALSGYERGYLTAYYDTVVFDAITDCCDDDWFGVQIGDRMFDINVWTDEDTGNITSTVYECDWINDNWQTNCDYSWTITKTDITSYEEK